MAGQHRVAGRAEQPGQPGHLGGQGLLGLGPLGRLGHPGERPGAAGELHVPGGQRLRAGRVEEQAADRAETVVAGGTRARPVGGQPLVAGQDLLGAHPPAAGPLGQPAQVATRVGQPVRVVHPEPVDQSVGGQAEDHRVSGLEHLGVFHPHRDQRADVEEPPPVQLGGGQPPVGQPVVLHGQQVSQWQPGGARADREHVVKVAQHRLGGPVDGLLGDSQIIQAVLQRGAQHRQQQPAVLRGPVHVEPGRELRGRPVPEHRPERPVQPLGHRDGHVVGHDVHDHAKPGGAEPAHHVPEPGLAAQVGGYPGVVHHVVTVRRSRGGLQDRRQVDVADAQRGQVVGAGGGVREPEAGLELEPVAGHRRPDRIRHGPGPAWTGSGWAARRPA